MIPILSEVFQCFGLSDKAEVLNMQHAQSTPEVVSFVQYTFRCAPQAMNTLNALVPMFHSKLPQEISEADAHINMLFEQYRLHLMTRDCWFKQQIVPLNDYLDVLIREVMNRYARIQQSGQKQQQLYPAQSSYSQITQQGNAYPMSNVSTGTATSLSVQTHFFPSEQSFKALVGFLESARFTLDICVFTITDDDIARAILAAHKRGVRVRIISDGEQSKSLGSDVERLASSGVPVKMDKSQQYHMHNKFCVVDGHSVLTGSYNWTKGARNNNQENIVIIHDQATSKQFSDQFEQLWKMF
ncbi:hypothetical protein MIR68_007305 [Amoeboaphelidium protococcarum]|nr:hypothetical protein MIR68_007305 [Amoeboaphelidium protococcarum]